MISDEDLKALNKHEQTFYKRWFDLTHILLIHAPSDLLNLPWQGFNRGFSADFLHLDSRVIIEIQGGLFLPDGGHNAKGAVKDYKKWTLAACNGWQTIPIPASMSKKQLDQWITWIEQIIDHRSQIPHPNLHKKGEPMRIICT